MVHRLFYLFIASLFLSFGNIEDAKIVYIESYLPLAIKEQKRSGIPVSIKLAQAFIESSGGTSVLASRANNHFGIKCKSYWTGPRYSILMMTGMLMATLSLRASGCMILQRIHLKITVIF